MYINHRYYLIPKLQKTQTDCMGNLIRCFWAMDDYDDFLEILTYTCPYSGRKRCAVEAGLDSETLQRMRMRLHLVQLIFVFLLVTLIFLWAAWHCAQRKISLPRKLEIETPAVHQSLPQPPRDLRASCPCPRLESSIQSKPHAVVSFHTGRDARQLLIKVLMNHIYRKIWRSFIYYHIGYVYVYYTTYIYKYYVYIHIMYTYVYTVVDL